MNEQADMKPDDTLATLRRPYVKPVVQRVDLSLEETLSAGCKLVDGCGADAFDPEGGVAGS